MYGEWICDVRGKCSLKWIDASKRWSNICQPCSDTRLRSTSRGDFIVPRFNRQLSNSSFSVAAPSTWNRLPSHIHTSSTYTLFLTRLKTHLFAESLLWHCDAVVFSLCFWHPRALDVGRHSKFMLIDWLIDWLKPKIKCSVTAVTTMPFNYLPFLHFYDHNSHYLSLFCSKQKTCLFYKSFPP